LRRAAQGIVEVAWAVHRAFPLKLLKADEHLTSYLLERLYTFDWPKVGSPAAADTSSAARTVPPRSPAPTRDVIEAVLASRPDDLVDAMDRVVSLARLNGNRTLLKAAKIIERTANILKGAKQIPQTAPDPSRFQDALEGKLWNLLTTRKPDVDALIAKKSYGEATVLYGEVFYDPLHEFFAKVMVNVEDPQIQQNRLALMRSLNALYTDRVADLSKLTILEEGKL
jgi:glycyl-tRNA synthetase beta chain